MIVYFIMPGMSTKMELPVLPRVGDSIYDRGSRYMVTRVEYDVNFGSEAYHGVTVHLNFVSSKDLK
jgi:hypothetical protein